MFSPCGQYYAAGTVKEQVAVWKVSQLLARGEVDRGKELAKWKMGNGVYSMVGTERYLVVGGREEVSGWDWDSDWQIELREKGEVNSMVIVKEGGTEGKLVLGMGDSNVYLNDRASGGSSSGRRGDGWAFYS